MSIKKQIIDWWALSTGVSPDVMEPEPTATVYNDAQAHWALNTDGFDANMVHNGIVASNTTESAGKVWDTALTFSRTSGGVNTIADSDQLSFTDGVSDLPFTVSFWIYPTEATGGQFYFILSKRGLSSNVEYTVSYIDNKIQVVLFSSGATSAYIAANSPNTVTINSWYFVEIKYTGSETFAGLSMKINNVTQALSNISSGSYTGMVNGTSAMSIGAASFDSTLGFVGRIQNLTIWKNKVLTTDESDYIYNSGNGRKFDNPTIYTESKYVLAQRKNYMFATDISQYLYWSNDWGATWINAYNWGNQYSAGRVYNKSIDFAYIFYDGTLLFSCANKLYRSTDQLLTINDNTSNVFLADGVTPFPFHTPADSTKPGAYFCTYSQFYKPAIINGKEVLMWNNYCNVASMNLGATPVQVWMTDDRGATVKAVYRMGQNTSFRDDGTSDGGGTGTLLGDATNPLICRHGHGCFWVPNTNYFLSLYGDTDGQVHWIKHIYSGGSVTNSNFIVSKNENTAWKALALCFKDSNAYWAADSSGVSPVRGVLREAIASLQNETYTQISNPTPGAQSEIAFIDEYTTRLLFADSANRDRFNLIADSGTGAITTIRVVNASSGSDAAYFPYLYGRNTKKYIKFNVGGFFDQVPRRTVFIKL